MIALCAGLFVAALCSHAQAPPATPVPPKPPVKEVQKSPDTSPPRAPVSTPAKQPTCVLVLPMTGFIGLEVTPRQLNDLVDEADKAGAGQVIVLEIDSSDGMSATASWFAKTIEKIRQRHKVVVWVKSARNVAAVIALLGHDIYMTPNSTLSVNPRIYPDCASEDWESNMREWMAYVAKAGHPPEIVSAMMSKSGCWYRKSPGADKMEFLVQDPATQDAVQLCASKEELVLKPQAALECGVIRGIAASEADLAKLIGLSEWKECSDASRKRLEARRALVKEYSDATERIVKGGDISNESRDPVSMDRRIKAFEELLSWIKKCPECGEIKGPHRGTVESFLQGLRKMKALGEK